MTEDDSLAHRIGEPYLLFMVFAAVGVGTVLVRPNVRLMLLWVVLVLLSVLFRSVHRVEFTFSSSSLLRGALLGLVISVPVLAFLSDQLHTFTERLYATEDVVLLFYQICFVSAPAEEYFFRGIVHSRKGSWVSSGLYAVAALLYFLPHAPLLALGVAVVMGVLGFVYAYVCENHGLVASVACHVVLGFTLQVVPSIIATVRTMLA
jgi:membrane protease YdiL (CAAX protease family)